MPINYQTITLPEAKADIAAVTREIESAFGSLRSDQLNWKPSAGQWSVGQCLEHLIASNQAYAPLLDDILQGRKQPTFWERMPLLPGFFGWLLIKSLSSKPKLKAPPAIQPASSSVSADIIQRYVNEQQAFLSRLDALAQSDLNQIVVTSPFISLMTYSVLDVFRITATHNRRHFAQAQRVTQTPGFPQ